MPGTAACFSLRNRWLRILGVSMVMYMLAFVDRSNLAMAVPAMRQDLGVTPQAMGLAAGAYFWGYLIPQIPAGRLASLWSPKKLILILVLCWSAAAMATAWVTTERGLAINRFALGLAEGGLLTAVLVLIHSWFTRAERARANGIFLLSLPAAGLVGGPLSGLILTHSTWQTMFIVEALPGLAWAVVWWFAIDDRPEHARWLPDAERERLVQALAAEQQAVPATLPGHGWSVLWHPAVLLLSLYNFCALMAETAIHTWYPTILKETGLSIGRVGMVAVLPAVSGMVLMTLAASSSDRHDERKWHMIAVTVVSGLALALIPLAPASPAATIGLLTLGIGAFLARFGPFWTLPSEVLPPAALGVGIGVIHGMGNLGGAVGPYFFAALRTHTGDFSTALTAAGMVLICSCVFALPLAVKRRTRPLAPQIIRDPAA